MIISVAIVFGPCSHQILAARPLEGEQWLKQDLGNIQSLRRGPVPPSGGSSCTNIPGRGRSTNDIVDFYSIYFNESTFFFQLILCFSCL
ncbi:hypothetical protein NC653_040779 [Populus alba x Populus x berolinensis]|uniref:Uncharacterized protein n=1 Tax=Populus alba x Populus x berolinensis TaxID=444605 RepID=A0AAD6L6V3_9ROSI|nr:hypothetical protein NC653_040779 [Populus alba x Populus x berolinensis]